MKYNLLKCLAYLLFFLGFFCFKITAQQKLDFALVETFIKKVGRPKIRVVDHINSEGFIDIMNVGRSTLVIDSLYFEYDDEEDKKNCPYYFNTLKGKKKYWGNKKIKILAEPEGGDGSSKGTIESIEIGSTTCSCKAFLVIQYEYYDNETYECKRRDTTIRIKNCCPEIEISRNKVYIKEGSNSAEITIKNKGDDILEIENIFLDNNKFSVDWKPIPMDTGDSIKLKITLNDPPSYM